MIYAILLGLMCGVLLILLWKVVKLNFFLSAAIALAIDVVLTLTLLPGH